MPAISRHPDLEELTAFSLGQLDGDVLTEVEGHVGSCPDCLAKAVAAPGDRLVGLLRALPARGTGRDTLSDIHAGGSTFLAVPGGAVPPFPDEADIPLPESLLDHDRYRVVRLLGRGGMGAVYEAEHTVMQRQVALKVINPAYTASAAAVERFRREARAAARLSHPNIVHAYDAETAGAPHFLVMEYVEGVTLARLVREGGPLPVARACEYARQAALGLQHAHERGLIHRDIKPENLILTADGRVKVLDFGLASLTVEGRRDGLTDDNVVMGTPDYMAPEQAEDARAADARADVYSLGCTLFYLLTGRVPYPAETPMRRILAHRERPVPSVRTLRPDVPAPLAAVIARMMAKRPEDRYRTAAAAAAAMYAPRESRRWLVAAAVFFVAAVGLLGGVVHHIRTDTGVMVIETMDDDVEVVVKQGGKVVSIYDTKSKQKLVLRSGTYELELKGKPTGLKLDLEKATLRRGDKVIAKVMREIDPKVKVPAEIEVVRRIPVAAAHGLFYATAVSKGGKYALVTYEIAPGIRCDVYEVATGKRVMSEDGYQALFLGDGEEVLLEYVKEFRIHETRTGKLLRKGGHGSAWKILVAPGDKHFVYWGGGNGRGLPDGYGLFDLVAMKDVRFWKEKVMDPPSFSPDGKRLFIPSANGKPWTVWDLDADRAAEDHRIVGALLWPFPDNKTAAVLRDRKLERIDLKTGKVVEALSAPPTTGAVQQTYSAEGRSLVARFEDGSFVQYRLPYDGKEFATFRLPRDDSSTPRDHQHIMQSISADGRFATLLTRKSMYVLRLPTTAR